MWEKELLIVPSTLLLLSLVLAFLSIRSDYL